MTRIGILLFDGVEELDAVGPWEMFGVWANQSSETELVTFAAEAGPIRASKGLTVHADRGFGDVGRLDVLVYPGGRGTRAHLEDESRLAWLRLQRDQVPIMASVCTGSLVFAAAGLLAGRPATTHWGSLEHLARLDPTIDVRRDERYVDDGDIVTSAGVSAGIDMALHLVVRLAGADRARQVRRTMQYDPEPPV
ncbi:putative transcription regulator, AraC family protein [Planotetraspora thailandica]|uniref:Putative transcription regulator, AraC family protein n=1 Tax=Planotetraspora thailandica TaxID=487172 RepID=A0A8J3XZG9_9ACTN|nr:DJ-1/PfpI family protein [Planotetraspora thailandica]GII58009.1 putative transcription regulator, AraC family protein [Planotetraspora thailandica]